MSSELSYIPIATIVMVSLVFMLIVFALLYQKRVLTKERQLSDLKIKLEQEELKSVYAELLGQEEERLRIAQDLHDDLGGILSGLKVYLDLISKKESLDSDLVVKMKKAMEQALAAVRRVSHDLGNVALERGGIQQALSQYCEELNSSENINVDCSISLSYPLVGQLGSDIYYISRELICNAYKHGEANDIRLDLTFLEFNEVSLIVEDNGTGFKRDKVKDGMGLRSVDLRVKRHGGNMVIDSPSNGRTTVIIDIPRSVD